MHGFIWKFTKYIISEKPLFSILTQHFQSVILYLLQADYYLFISSSIVVLEKPYIKVHIIYIFFLILRLGNYIDFSTLCTLVDDVTYEFHFKIVKGV